MYAAVYVFVYGLVHRGGSDSGHVEGGIPVGVRDNWTVDALFISVWWYH